MISIFFIFQVSRECIGIVVFCIRDYISRIRTTTTTTTTLKEFSSETSVCTDDFRKDETCLQFKTIRNIIGHQTEFRLMLKQLEKCSYNHRAITAPSQKTQRAESPERADISTVKLLRDFSSFDIMLLHLKLQTGKDETCLQFNMKKNYIKT